MVLLIQAVMEPGNTIDMMDLFDGNLMMLFSSDTMNFSGGIFRLSFDGGVLGLFLIGGCFNSLYIG